MAKKAKSPRSQASASSTAKKVESKNVTDKTANGEAETTAVDREAASAELETFTSAFGLERGVDWFKSGKSFAEAQALHASIAKGKSKAGEPEFMVTLKPHVGTKATPRGPVPVQFAQDYVFLNGTHVGYVGHQPNAPVCTIVRLDPHTAQRLREEVAMLRDNVGERVSQVPSTEQLAELDNQEIDDDEDDDFEDD